jgi:hypothetical protein
MKVLCISNGHGEDVIALRILTSLRQIQPQINLTALPIAGAGSAYLAAKVPIAGPVQNLPSGGFLNRDPKQLARDLHKGLVALTRSQLSTIKTWAKTGDVILAVGDIVPLLFAYLSGRPYIFIGTAKSEYWLRDERGKLPATGSFPHGLWEKLEGWSGSVYLPWERWLMSCDRAQAIFVRDAITARQLQRLGIKAHYAGNPMMDALAPTGRLSALLEPLRTPRLLQVSNASASTAADTADAKDAAAKDRATALYVTKKQQPVTPLTIALLPGSRPPEAYANWQNILAAVPSLSESFPQRPLILLAAVAPSLSLSQLQDSLNDWQPVSAETTAYPTFTFKGITLLIISDAYSDCLHEAEIAIATAGTATEQFVGLGKPAITLPGKGPQFTQAFATVQAKMLGPSIQKVSSPTEIGPAIAKIMSNPDRLQLVYENGKQRMGEPGAGSAIALQISQILLPQKVQEKAPPIQTQTASATSSPSQNTLSGGVGELGPPR